MKVCCQPVKFVLCEGLLITCKISSMNPSHRTNIVAAAAAAYSSWQQIQLHFYHSLPIFIPK